MLKADLLHLGSRGNAVLQLQNRLQQLGYYDGSVDGLFGPATQAAVTAFQASQKLEPDGIVRNQTWTELILATTPGLALELEILPMPPLSELSFIRPAPPPSSIWLVVMPLIPLVGGLLTFLKQFFKPQQSP